MNATAKGQFSQVSSDDVHLYISFYICTFIYLSLLVTVNQLSMFVSFVCFCVVLIECMSVYDPERTCNLFLGDFSFD